MHLFQHCYAISHILAPKFFFPLRLGAYALPSMQGYFLCQHVCSPFTLYKNSLPRPLYLFIPLISKAACDENQATFSSSGMVSGSPFLSEWLQACHCHTPPSAQTPLGAQPLRLAVLGQFLESLAGPGGICMAKPPPSLHASPKPYLRGRLLISLYESATC